ncbi:MAG: hypothetical protein NTZ08_00640, partial [Verrucomicrobia bacterium]|nr:hypothetical protein [Verrucomicrobiota bacterium]
GVTSRPAFMGGAESGGEPWRCAWRQALGGRGDAVAFGQREPATTPTPEPHEYCLSRYYCGT